MALRRSIFREATLIASSCPDRVRRDVLRDRTLECREAYDLLCISPTRETMVELVARFTRLIQAMDAIAPLGGDNPNGGRMTVPQEEVKAHVA